jgi:Flp pilus assembly protein TadD
MKSGKYEQAIATADRFITAKPRDPQMRFLKGVAQAEAGKAADAIATYTQLTQDYPELPEPYNNLAALQAAQGQFDKAREALEGAVRANPNYATAHENLGDVYTRLATQSYTKAQQLDANNATVAPKLAMSRQLLGTPKR